MNKVWLFILLSLVFLLFLVFVSVARGQKAPVDFFFPVLGNYANKSVQLGGSSTIAPDSGASNIGTATVSVSGHFKGSVTVSPTSGAVRVLNAYPAGNYTVTVRAADFAGFTLTRTFNLTVTNVSSCNTLDFTKAAATVENNPFGLVAADFNGDGRQDAATLNSGSNSISVLLGNGSGGFGTVTNFALPPNSFNANGIVVGDFNGDNKADLAVGNTFNSVGNISVFLGTGTGSFSAPNNYTLGTTNNSPRLAAGDYNGDGRMDVAVGNISNNIGVSILFRDAANNGFDSVTNLNLGFTITSLASADFNSDGRHDLVVNRQGANSIVALVRNAANNGFDSVPMTINGTSGQVIVGDFTGDGRQDIAAAYSGGLDILPRNALGFDGPSPAGFSVNGTMDIGDFNNDGRLDIAYSQSGSFAAIAYRNLSNSGFDFPVAVGTAGFATRTIAAADFNNDGRADIAALNGNGSNAGSVSVLRRNGTNVGFDTSPAFTIGNNIFPNSFSDAALGDFNNDGIQDLAFATNGTQNISVYQGNGNGGFANLTNVTVSGSNPTGFIAAADFNNDGNVDLVVPNSLLLTGGSGFSVLNGAGNGSFATVTTDVVTNFNVSRIAVGDFNGDGRADLALNRQSTNQTHIYLRNTANSGFDSPVILTNLNNANSLAVGDLNNDGRDDLAIGYPSTAMFSVILRNSVNNGFDTAVNYNANTQNGFLTIADFDGDGNEDIAYGANEVSVYYGSATGVFGLPTSYGGFLTANYLASGDFNGDGRQDIVAATQSYFGSSGRASVVVLTRNAANNGFDFPIGFNGGYVNSSSLTQKIFVGEINGDGRQDLLTSNGFSGSLLANFSAMTRVCAVDLNLRGALPNGTAGQTYSKTIYANGGIAPYNFTVSGLPNGLNYSTTADSITIFGTPLLGGQYGVLIGINDSNPFSEMSVAPQAANSMTQVLPLQIAFAPTAANVSISGRILTADSKGLSGAIVKLTDENGAVLTAQSSSLGTFQFNQVEAGQTYVLTVSSKRGRFDPQIISVSDDVTDLVLTAIE